MRVIAGSRKGLRLKSGRDQRIRPTTDSTKEFIFNVIGAFVQGSNVLDIFAGTGSLGIEALSRGAAKAVFVETNRNAQKLLRGNLQTSGFLKSAKLVNAQAQPGLKRLAAMREKFDLILADPPYESSLAHKTLTWLSQQDLVSTGGLIVIEQAARTSHKDTASDYTLVYEKKKGDTLVSFYRYEA